MGKNKGFLFFGVILISSFIFADYRITRGPEIGEIYFIGPTVTESAAIYHSTDFGETATCMDSTLNTNINFMSITADLTPGVLYGYAMPENLYISYNYGEEGSWNFISNGGHWCINSGRYEGEIYDSFSKHSEDYGVNFIQHSAIGFFGSSICTEIDNENNIGHMLVSNYPIIDSLWILITYDNFETLEIQNVVNRYEYPYTDLSRGMEYGELYNITSSPRTIFYSNDYGLNWQYINQFNPGLDYTDFVGGRQAGEVYVLVTYVALMHTIDHTYIFHSTDDGRTFTVYHPFAKGEEPLVANFSSSLTEGAAPFSVQFNNYSVGEIISYEWDFDNDGTIDSYELEPEYTYLDTGYYSVKLIIHDQDGTDEFLREDFIHVTNGSGVDNHELEIRNYKLMNHPNPFNPVTTISFSIPENKKVDLSLYNIKGQKVKTLIAEELSAGSHIVNWNGKDNNNKQVASGIYFYKLKAGNYHKVKKMILIK
jgi:PKD repeat protein